jgi:hypothetical protein
MSVAEELLFPDTREVLFELIDGGAFSGRTVAAYYLMPVDDRGRPAYADLGTDEAVALIYTTGGTQGWIDRVDRATVEVYAPGTAAVDVAEAIRARIVGEGIDTAEGYVDEISCDVTPHDVPHASEAVNLGRASYLVTTRPL